MATGQEGRCSRWRLTIAAADRYPNLRIGYMECGHGWLPQWILRLTRQIDYVQGSVPADIKHTPIEYLQMGRVFCGIDFS